MSTNAAINKFNENLTKLLDNIENLFDNQTIDRTVWMKLYTYIFYKFNFISN